MNRKKMQNDICTLDKDIANCEYYLNRVLSSRYNNNKISLAKASTEPKPRTAPVKNTTKTHPPENEPKQRISPRDAPQTDISVPNTKRTDSNKSLKRIIHKEVFNNAATVEVTVKTKQPEANKTVTKNCQTDPESCVLNKKYPVINNQRKELRQKNLSWGQLLQANKLKELEKNSKKSSSCVCCSINKHENNQADKEQKAPTVETLSTRSRSDDALSYGAFSMFNPVRTMNFLIKELSSKMNKNTIDDNEMHKILINMEHTLNRLYSDYGSNEPPIDSLHTLNVIESPPSPPQPLITITDEEKPQQDNLKTTTTQTSLIEPPSLPFIENDTANNVIERLQISCEKLEATCTEMKATCEELKRDKAFLKEELEIRNQELESTKLKEKEYSKILESFKQNFNNMTKKSDEYIKTISQLTIENNKLREEIKPLDELRTTNKQLSLKILELEKTNDKLDTELQILKLEKEKFHFILERKDSEISKFKGDIGDINRFLKNKFTDIQNVNKQDEEFNLNIQSEINPVLRSNSSSGSNHSTNKGMIICSSPTGSNNSPDFYESWHILSKISPDTNTNNNNKEPIFPPISEVDTEPPTSPEHDEFAFYERESINNSETKHSIRLTPPHFSDVASVMTGDRFETLQDEPLSEVSHPENSESDGSPSWRTQDSIRHQKSSATDRLKNGLENLLAQFSQQLQGATENIVHQLNNQM